MELEDLLNKVKENSYIETNEGIAGVMSLTGMIIMNELTYSKTFDSLQTETEYFVNGYFM